MAGQQKLIDPQLVECPACFSHPGERCTVPTDTGRRQVSWTHYSRQSRAAVQSTVPVKLPELEGAGFLVLDALGNVTLHDDMREAEAVAVVEHGAVYAITLHRDYRG